MPIALVHAILVCQCRAKARDLLRYIVEGHAPFPIDQAFLFTMTCSKCEIVAQTAGQPAKNSL
jgi:hypothetical protein